MNRTYSRSAPGRRLEMEALEGRIVLSRIGSSGALPSRAAEFAAQTIKKAATETTLAVNAGTLSQPTTFTVTVRAPAAAGSPVGTVNLTSAQGKLIQTLTLSPTTSTNRRFAVSEATLTVTSQPGGPANFFGKYNVKATFVPGGTFSRSSASKTFTVSQPAFTTLANGVNIATVASGSGPQIQSGQTASVLYTGYLAQNGQIFDDSSKEGGAPLSFVLGSGQLIPGFDAGTAGMRVGETRIIVIPPSQGYGSTANGAIPANSTLVFVVTLESIS